MLNRKLAVAVGIILVAAAGVVSAHFLLEPAGSPSYPVDPSTFGISAAATSQVTGMKITAELSNTTIRSGQELTLTITAFNTLPQDNNLSFVGFPLPGMVGINIPWIYTSAGVSMYEGYYTRENITSATPLSLPPITNSGPPTTYLYIVFEPSSSYATLFVRNDVVTGQPSFYQYSYTYSGTGVITGNCSNEDCLVNQLKPGIYTIAVGAAWDKGNFVLLHFLLQ